jgi:thymidylate kinase
VDAKVAQARIQNRPGGNHFDDRKMEFHEKVRAGLLKFRDKVNSVLCYLVTEYATGDTNTEPAPRAELVDANQTPDEVYASVVKIIEAHLAVRSHKE